MSENDLSCKIYVGAGESQAHLADEIASYLRVERDGNTLTSGLVEIDVRKNDEFSAEKQRIFPDGFLYFPYALEVYVAPGAEKGEVVGVVASLLNSLWARGIPAVAACDYEEELPHHGGYNTRAVPWFDA